MTRSSFSKAAWPVFTAAAALTGWCAVALQLGLSLQLAAGKGLGVAAGLAIYLGYFTVQTNILVALALTVPLIAAHSRWGCFFARPGVNTAIAAYIAVVGMVYSLLLRHIWHPQGLQLVVDHLLHDVMPIVFLIYWWGTVPKRDLGVRQVPMWLLYPLGYFVYSLVRGRLTGRYPYPFIDVSIIGYGQTLINAVAMLAFFCLIAVMLLAVSRLQKPCAANA